MDWSSVIYSAIGAGGGAALGTALFFFVQKLRGKPKTIDKDDKAGAGLRGLLAGGLAILGVNVLSAQYKNMTLPRIVPADHAEMFEALPLLAIIKEENPKDFERLMFPIDKAVRNRKMSQSILNDSRSVYSEIIVKQTKIASADSLRRLDQVVSRQAVIFKEKKPEICTLSLNGEPYPALTEIIDAGEARFEQNAAVRLFTDPPRDLDFTPDLERGKKIFEEIVVNGLKELNITNIRPVVLEGVKDNLRSDPQYNLEHQKICDLLILMTKKKSVLSDDDFINVTVHI